MILDAIKTTWKTWNCGMRMIESNITFPKNIAIIKSKYAFMSLYEYKQGSLKINLILAMYFVIL